MPQKVFGAVLIPNTKFLQKISATYPGQRRATVPLPRRVAFGFMGGGSRSQHRASGPAHPAGHRRPVARVPVPATLKGLARNLWLGSRIFLTSHTSSVTSSNTMRTLSTTEAARRLKLSRMSLYRHISSGKVAAPPSEVVGGVRVRLWSARDIERVRKQLPEIKSGRRKRRKK